MTIFGVSSVRRPTTPTSTPAMVTTVEAWRFFHAGARPDLVSTRLAESKGKRASTMRARSAPWGSAPAPGSAEPTGPKSNSWLPTAAAA
jgi:hypothetical protein